MPDKEYYKARFFMTLKIARMLKHRPKPERLVALTAARVAFTDAWTGRASK